MAVIDARSRPKHEYRDRTSGLMREHLAIPPWSLTEKLALTCRILARDGHEAALSGQISARAPQSGAYWMLRFGLGFDEAHTHNIVLCDADLNVIQGEGMVNAANRFHLWIYRERPEVNCIVHTHPPHASALSMIGEPLSVSHMDSAVFHEDCAYLADWPGLPIGDEEGQVINAAMGQKRCILLAHHGLLTACGTVEEAAMLALFMERAARLQLLARAAGTINPIPASLAREAHDWRLKPEIIGAQFHYYARRVLAAGERCLE